MATVVANLRKEFPILSTKVRGKRFCYLDSAASAQKPLAVINKYRWMQEECYANVHRAAYLYGEQLTAELERARGLVAEFMGAPTPNEIVFTKNATEGFNLLAYSYGRHLLKKGDKILLSVTEHHANMVPWQMLRDETGVELIYVDIDADGRLNLDQLYQHLPQVKLLALTHCSNVLGNINPIKDICRAARAAGVVSVIDGTQSICHEIIRVEDLGCDFFIFSGHKLYGPTGVGVLWGRMELLKKMPPFLGGGDMISEVHLDKTLYAEPPIKFEAGTPPIMEIISLGAAIAWLNTLPLAALHQHEHHLMTKVQERLQHYDAVWPLSRHGVSLVAFAVLKKDGTLAAHPHDVATLLDQSGVALRAGHHCAMPLHERLVGGARGAASTRLSLGLYSDQADIDQFFDALDTTLKILKLQ